jgi:peptide/nickel transport system substrate-binding protein
MLSVLLSGIAVASLSGPAAAACGDAAGRSLVETPYLGERVASGALPPVGQRVPDCPAVAAFDGVDQSIGRHGGTLTSIIRKSRDVKLLVVYGYARLVGYDRTFTLKPDILEDFTVKDGRIFTFTLRAGHKWSDGHPFTTEDFRYWWNEVANDPNLSPSGPPKSMLVNGLPPQIDILDDRRVRYSWTAPHPTFLSRLAGPSPLFLYRPAHYLKRFHKKFADKGMLDRAIHNARLHGWAALHNRLDNMYLFDNPDLPTLQPWVNRTTPPATRFVAERNPFYHRIDPKGRQLPYLDRVALDVVSPGLIPVKAGLGEADLVARGLSFQDYTFLRDRGVEGSHETLLWRKANGSQIALFPNQNVRDPGWRALMRNALFRRALSLATDREQINEFLFFGFGRAGNDTVLEESPLYKPDYQLRWARFDIDHANRLLDEIGLNRRNSDNIRLMPDGRPLNVIVETAGEQPEQIDALEIMQSGWAAAGVGLIMRPMHRETLRARVVAGETMMAVWGGMENALPTTDSNPEAMAPFSQINFQWPKWGLHVETDGKSGEPIDVPEVETLQRLVREWGRAADADTRLRIWHRILEIHADQTFVIGTVSGIRQPVVRSRKLMNLPREGVYNWDPGAFFGIYRPDTFWKKE